MINRVLNCAPSILLWIAVGITLISIGHAILMYDAARDAMFSAQRVEHTPIALATFLADLANRIGWATVPFGFAALLYRLDRRAGI